MESNSITEVLIVLWFMGLIIWWTTVTYWIFAEPNTRLAARMFLLTPIYPLVVIYVAFKYAFPKEEPIDDPANGDDQ